MISIYGILQGSSDPFFILKKMTGLPEFFEQTSDKPYDRHNYKIVYTTGESKVVESWEEVNIEWFTRPFLSCVEVLDKKQKSKGGFK